MKLRRIIWIVGGFVAFGLGTLGTMLPVLPTVPLYLLTAFCFANSSQKLHDWFLSTGLYKHYLEPYVQAGGLPAAAKTTLILFVTLQLAIAAFLLRHSILGLIVVAVVYLCFLFSMFFIVKTVPKKKGSHSPAQTETTAKFTQKREKVGTKSK